MLSTVGTLRVAPCIAAVIQFDYISPKVRPLQSETNNISLQVCKPLVFFICLTRWFIYGGDFLQLYANAQRRVEV